MRRSIGLVPARLIVSSIGLPKTEGTCTVLISPGSSAMARPATASHGRISRMRSERAVLAWR